MAELKETIDEYDVLAITETWLYPEYQVKINGYIVIRKDTLTVREGRRRTRPNRGGLCLIIREQLGHEVLNPTEVVDAGLDVLRVKITTGTDVVKIALVYRCPEGVMLEESLTETLRGLQLDNATLVMGDFNAKCTDWNCMGTDVQVRSAVRICTW